MKITRGNFPSTQYLQGRVDQTPDDFMFGFKVTDAITIKRFPNLPRFGDQAGKPNENFLNAGLRRRRTVQISELAP